MWLLAAAAIGIFLVLISLLLSLPAVYGWNVFSGLRGTKTVVCPESQAGATVHIDAIDAAAHALHGYPRVRLTACSRWPSRRDCGQECVVQLIREPMPERSFNFFPVLLAAVWTWAILGTLAYTSVGRGVIIQLGVPADVVQRGYELAFPALVPLAIAIGLAFVIQKTVERKRRSPLTGALLGATVGLALSAIALPLIPHPGTILWIYAGFVVLASAVMGAFLTSWRTAIAPR